MESVKERVKITPEKVLAMLQEEGLIVTLEQATEILIFLKKLANIAVSNFLQHGKNS